MKLTTAIPTTVTLELSVEELRNIKTLIGSTSYLDSPGIPDTVVDKLYKDLYDIVAQL